jgi:taurine dioxygenase
MRIAPLLQGFGAEVLDFDVQNGREPEDIARLQQAFGDHHLLIFRGDAQMTPERQLEITGWLGPVIVEGTAWTVLDNAEPAGRKELPFHSDITFMEFPLAGISLYPQELPANSTSTTYVSNSVAWQQLPEALQKKLRNLKARHYFDASDEVGFDWPVFEYWHPVCLLHPKSGQPLLFVTEHHVDRIENMTVVRGAELLKKLCATLYAPERRYEHVWRRGDLLIWDNLAIQHARTRAAELSQGKRVMRRVQLGTIGFIEQLERVRRQRAELTQ